jgi:hypothetical protein
VNWSDAVKIQETLLYVGVSRHGHKLLTIGVSIDRFYKHLNTTLMNLSFHCFEPRVIIEGRQYNYITLDYIVKIKFIVVTVVRCHIKYSVSRIFHFKVILCY